MTAQSFIFYGSFIDAISTLGDADRLAAFDAITNYAGYGIEPDSSIGLAYAIFLMAKPQIDANAKRREDGSKGGRPKGKTSGYESKKPVVSEKENHTSENEKPKEKEKVKVKVNVKEKDKEKDIAPEVAVATLDAPDEVKQRMQEFVNMRKAIKKPMTGNAVRLMYGRLVKLSKEPTTQCEILEQSIRHSWQDVYALKDEKARSGTNKFNNIIQHDWNMDELERKLLGV